MARHFKADMVSVSKREIRQRLYDDVREILPRISTFGLLAGAAPAEEIGAIRTRYYRPDVTAFDSLAACVVAAEACGVEAVRGDLAKTIRDRSFDFFDLDLCKTLATQGELIQEVAGRCRGGLAVFVSYRNDARGSETTTRAERANKTETTKLRERATEIASSVNPKRATEIASSVNPKRASHQTTTRDEKRAMFPESTTVEERVITGETASESTISPERATMTETTMLDERAAPDETSIQGERLTNAQRERVERLTSLVRGAQPKAHLRRAYAYRGNACMMVGALFVFRRVEELPPYHTSYEEMTPERVYILRALGGNVFRKKSHRS